MTTDKNGLLIISDPLVAKHLVAAGIPVFKQTFNGKEYFAVKDDKAVRQFMVNTQSSFENLFVGKSQRLTF